MANGTDASDPDTGDSGDVDSAELPCERNDIEVVSDLEEPPAVRFESAHEEETDPGLIFSAVIVEPDGNVISMAGPGGAEPEEDATRAGGEEVPDEADAAGAADEDT